MTSDLLTNHDIAVWRQIVESYKVLPDSPANFEKAKQVFLSYGIHHVKLLRAAISLSKDDKINFQAGINRYAAFHMISYLPTEERKHLLSELIEFASIQNAHWKIAWDTILSLPHDWLVQHIEEPVNHYLETVDQACDKGYLCTGEEYGQIMALYEELDEGLALKLAKQALSSPYISIRQIGEQYLASKKFPPPQTK